MSNTLFIFFVSIVAIGVVVGIAYLLDKRSKKTRPADPPLPELGPIGTVLLWIARTIVVLMVFSIIGAFVFRSLTLVSVTVDFLGLYVLDGIIYRVFRTTGK